MNAARISTLIGKELREFRASPAALLPVVILIVICTLLPFLVVTIVPRATGQAIENDRTLQQVVLVAQLRTPSLEALPPHAATEAFLFQQFLLMFLVAPIVGAVSLAAYAVVGEKQQRTLEALLTTPIGTPELLVAKAIASFLPSMVLEAAGVVVYFGLIALVGAPGVLATLLTARTAILLVLFGPLAALAALQATIAVSSRVNDPRSAQQIAALLVLPLVAMLVGQIAGAFFLSSRLLIAISAAIALVWMLLILLSVALFERETILTRWR